MTTEQLEDLRADVEACKAYNNMTADEAKAFIADLISNSTHFENQSEAMLDMHMESSFMCNLYDQKQYELFATCFPAQVDETVIEMMFYSRTLITFEAPNKSKTDIEAEKRKNDAVVAELKLLDRFCQYYKMRSVFASFLEYYVCLHTEVIQLLRDIQTEALDHSMCAKYGLCCDLCRFEKVEDFAAWFYETLKIDTCSDMSDSLQKAVQERLRIRDGLAGLSWEQVPAMRHYFYRLLDYVSPKLGNPCTKPLCPACQLGAEKFYLKGLEGARNVGTN